MKSKQNTNKINYTNDEDMTLVYVNCYNCESSEYEHYDSEYGYNLVKCIECGLLYVNPRPNNKYISKAAMLGVHTGAKEKYVTGKYHPNKIKSYLKKLEDLFPERSLRKDGLNWLDIGCGFGEFIEALALYSHNTLDVTGLDTNQEKIISAKKRDLNVSTTDLDKIKENYNFISLLNVYSHIPNPYEFFSVIKNKLKENGEFLLQTGHTSHLSNKYHPKPYDLPDHLSFANKTIIISMLERTGFEIVEVKMYRSPDYPKYYEIIKIIKLFVKILIRRGEKISHLFPKYPNIDMYIRCRLVGKR